MSLLLHNIKLRKMIIYIRLLRVYTVTLTLLFYLPHLTYFKQFALINILIYKKNFFVAY